MPPLRRWHRAVCAASTVASRPTSAARTKASSASLRVRPDDAVSLSDVVIAMPPVLAKAYATLRGIAFGG